MKSKLTYSLTALALLFPAVSDAALRVAIAPVKGSSRYPLVMIGLRQVLWSDLTQSGSVQVVETDIPADQISTANLPSLANRIPADTILILQFMDIAPQFQLSIRAYNVETGYNVGSTDLTGEYGDIKHFQDRLLSATLDLLRSPVPADDRARIAQTHTKELGAVAAVGEADAALRDKRYVDAFEGFARSRSIDPNFKAPMLQLEKNGQAFIAKLPNPADSGRAYAFMGDPKKAAEAFDQALAKDPKDVTALVGKGDLMMQLGQAKEALPFYQRAAQAEPQNAMAQVGIAKAQQELGNKAEAQVAYEKAKNLGATRPEVYESLGSLYAVKGNAKGAAEAYQTAGELSERVVNFSKAQRYYAQVNKLLPTAASLEREADTYIQMGQTQVAITLLTKALFIEPNRDTIFAKLGYAYYLNRQPSEAIKKFQKAYDLNSSNFEANYYLGILLLSDRELHSRAVRHLEAAARLRPSDLEVQHSLARAYVADGRIDAAIAIYQQLAAIFPRDATLHKETADAYFIAKDFSRAEISYNRAIELAPDYVAAYEGLAKIFLTRGDRAQALEVLSKLYAIDAQNNFFVRGGDEFLGKVVPPAMLNIARSFRKTVTAPDGEATINQVSLVRLIQSDSRSPRGLYQRFLKFYTVQDKTVMQDLELALFSQYRVVPLSPQGPWSGGSLDRGIFDLDSEMSQALAKANLDGLFGMMKIENFTQNESATEVTLDVALYSRADGGRYEEKDVSQQPKLVYPTKDVLKFNPLAPIAYGILLFLLTVPGGYITIYRARVRGKGNLKVIINYDPKLESFLTLKLSTTQEKEKDPRLVMVRDKDKYEKRKYKDLLKQSGAWVRKMVGKVTLFENVPARNYYCYLYGTIEDATMSKKTIGNYYMVQKVQIEKGKTKEIIFQLEKEDAFVTVFVRKGEEDVAGAEIRVTGDPEMKFSRGSAGTFVYLRKGKHKITVTHEGRSVTQVVEIFDLNDRIVNIDLQTVEEAVDTANDSGDLTETAQNFEQQGRLEEAAQLYDKAGDTGRAGETRAQAFVSEGDMEAAAGEFVKSRDFLKAGDLYSQAGNSEKANYMYGLHSYQAGDLPKALGYLQNSDNFGILAKIYDRMGEKSKSLEATAKGFLAKGQKIEAAQTFTQAESFGQAADIYESLGDLPKAAMLHAKDGNYSLAGELFAQFGDQDKAALAFEKGGLYEQAISLYKTLGKMDKVMELLTHDQRYLEAATLYREQGMIDEGIALCQKVPSFHADFGRTQVLLANMFSEKGLDDLALKTFSEAVTVNAGELDSESWYAYASVLERGGQYAKALEILEDILKKDFHFKDVSLRIEDLKKKVTSAKAVASMAGSNPASETIGGAEPKKETRYEVIEELGRGAMGIVYKARDKMLDRIVAFKTLPQTLKDDSEALESLMREAQTAAKLNHPNIVTVFDVGQENGNYFIAMEYAQGKTLQQVLKQVKRVNLQNFQNIAKPLCDVIAYAHEQRVIHRDVKPSNIILLASRTVKLMDFGLAKVLQEMSIDKTMLRGTPLYMAPEQVLGKDIDHRTDIYSLGIVFYELLSGAPPFTEGDIMYAHLHTPPPPLAEKVTGIPENVTTAIMSCLSKDKTKRPATARELAKALGLA